LYLAAWTPIAGLLASLLRFTGDFSWIQAAELTVPLSLVYAFMCLYGWYLCRFVRIENSGIVNLLAANLVAAAVASLIWAGGIAWALAAALGLEAPYMKSRVLLFGAGVLLCQLASAFHYVLLAMETSREAQSREMEASILAREAELRALKAQIDPHFLFNSLHSISALTACDPAKAREMCILLSDFLRSSLGMGDRDQIPLGDELALARNFLAIQQVRFGARLRIEERLDDSAKTCLVPPLVLQPLVENAVTHGIATLVDGGSIELETRLSGGEVAITIENTFDPEAPRRRRTGLGLPNVRKRIAARYGPAAKFDVSENGGRFRVRLVLPAGAEEKS
jgi:hypothetical protein